MSATRKWIETVGIACLGGAFVCGTSGCGKDRPTPEQTASQLPTLSISSPKTTPKIETGPPVDSAELALQEITLLRLKTLPTEASVAEIREFQRQRNTEIVALAQHAIARSHADEAKSSEYRQAVHHLLEARTQLALQHPSGEEAARNADIETLYDHAEQVIAADPSSPAALEAGLSLVAFAETMARKFGGEEPRWLEEYSRQAQLFARRFPGETEHVIKTLDAAGWSCDAHGLTEAAAACYTTLQEMCPDDKRTAHVSAILRRLTLVGQPLKLAGPTIDGGYVDLEQFQGTPTVVAFWASETEGAEVQLPELKKLADQFANNGLNVVSVNLDFDEAIARDFLSRHQIEWPTVFYAAPDQRGWKNPIVKYYGLRRIPAYWLVNADGTVASTFTTLPELAEHCTDLLK
ncbi:peroxiredoxin family protein [Thalassoroseus pseudoceratinae]|uniref:peroxiredoxin family protein n=1 Tax=Thalassoroseus pseudoceratinae TaxID=2713176 RepID=UPI00141EE5B2|nr:TlpA disulfide reductase family protein [Thalassoroseus pseudoceratinae]